MEMKEKKNVRPKEGDNFQIYQLLVALILFSCPDKPTTTIVASICLLT
jgi:hypothetical protein